MADDEQFERIKRLAQKVWPDAQVAPQYIGFTGGACSTLRGYSVKSSDRAYSDGACIWHPRALDALEAALYVLAGVDGLLSPLQHAKAQEKLAQLEGLADKWTEMARAETEDVEGDPAVAAARKMCAADVRALLRVSRS